jgi:hypothetical protein
MGFWDSFKAALYGQAGVDYYANKSNETLTEIRDRLDAGPARGEEVDLGTTYQPRLGEIDAPYSTDAI